MATTQSDTTLLDRCHEFLRNYYHEEVAELAQHYPDDQKSLTVDWMDLFRFDPAFSDDYRTDPGEMQSHLEEALREFDLLFMIDDQPDAEQDADIIEGMIETRRAAAKYTDRGNRATGLDRIEPAVDTDVLRAWVAHAKQTCTPTIKTAAWPRN